MIEIELIKKDKTTINKEEFFINNILPEKRVDLEKEEIQGKINFCIRLIIETDDLKSLHDQLIFLSDYLKENDFVFPPEFIQKLLLFLRENKNSQEIPTALKLLRLSTSFESIMQKFLIDNGIIDAISPFFPNKEVIKTFSNLSLCSNEIRAYLLNTGIIDIIKSKINDINYFKYLVDLLRRLLSYNEDFKYDNYIIQFIQIFHELISFANNGIYSPILIINAFRDYIEADERFLNDFLTNNQLLHFLSLKIPDEEYNRTLLRMCELIIYEKKNDGAQYLIDINIISFISQMIFNESVEIRTICFCFLYLLVDYAPFISDFLISQDFHILAVKEYDNNSKYFKRKSIFKFCCLLLLNSSPQYLAELIETDVVNLIIDNSSILECEEECVIIINSIYRLKDFMNLEILRNQVQLMKNNEDFLDWIHECCSCQNECVVDAAYDLSSQLLFAGENEEEG